MKQMLVYSVIDCMKDIGSKLSFQTFFGFVNESDIDIIFLPQGKFAPQRTKNFHSITGIDEQIILCILHEEIDLFQDQVEFFIEEKRITIDFSHKVVICKIFWMVSVLKIRSHIQFHGMIGLALAV